MHSLTSTAAAIAIFAAPAFAHMAMVWPPALRAPENPQYNSTNVDHNYVLPLRIDGSDFPCKGYHPDVPSISTATTTLEPGSNFTVSLKGLTYYQGGSCQFSLSYDAGQTWGVIESIVGNCPSALAVDYTFRVPVGLPDAKNVLLAWSWFNKVGNREMYMNCASVDVLNPPGNPQGDYVAQRMFEANVFDHSCITIAGQNVDFADPVLQNCEPGKLITPDQTVTFTSSGEVPAIVEDDVTEHLPVEPSTVPVTPRPTAPSAPSTNAWSPDRVFVGGDNVCESGVSYTAKWWNKGEKPSTSEAWTKGPAC